MNRLLPLTVATAAMLACSVVQAQGRSPRGMSMGGRGMSPSSMRSSMSSRMSGSSMRAPTSSMRAPTSSMRAPSASFRAPTSNLRPPSSSLRVPSISRSPSAIRVPSGYSSRSLSTRSSLYSPISPLYSTSRLSYGVRSPRATIGATIPRAPRTSSYYGTSSLRYPSSYYSSRYRSPGLSYGIGVPYSSIYGYGYAPSIRVEYRSPAPTYSTAYSAPAYPSYEALRAEADYQARLDQLERLEQLERELRQRTAAARPAVVASNTSAPMRLAASLASMKDGEVWIEYLAPQTVARALEQRDTATLNRFALSYIGVVKNPSLANIASLPGFAETKRMLEPYANAPRESTSAPMTSTPIAPREMSLAPAARAPESAPEIEPGTQSILEQVEPVQQADTATEEIPLPAPLPQPAAAEVDEI